MGAFFLHILLNKIRDLLQRRAAVRELREDQGKVMRHPGVDGERHRDAARRRTRCELLVLRAEHLAAARLDEQGRQPTEIGIERREARIIARACTAAVVARLEQWVERRSPAENAVGIGIRRA